MGRGMTIRQVEQSNLMPNRTAEDWEAVYQADSPFYAQLKKGYGHEMRPNSAERICYQHGVAIEALVQSGELTIDRGMVNTLALVQALGY